MTSSARQCAHITTQRTSKPLKAHLALSGFLFWFALLSWFLPYGHYMDVAGMSWSGCAVVIGAISYIATKMLIWWNHE